MITWEQAVAIADQLLASPDIWKRDLGRVCKDCVNSAAPPASRSIKRDWLAANPPFYGAPEAWEIIHTIGLGNFGGEPDPGIWPAYPWAGYPIDADSYLDLLKGYSSVDGVLGSVASRLTCGRNVAALADDLAGDWRLFPPFAPRLTDRGLLYEEARTNLDRNSGMAGAVVGVIGSGGALPTNWSIGGAAGLTKTVVEIGTDRGIDYIDVRINGTSSDLYDAFYFDVGITGVLTAQPFTSSLFLTLKAGGIAGLNSNSAFRYLLTPSGFTDIATVSLLPFLVLGAPLTRVSASGTTAGTPSGTAQHYFQLTHASGIAIDYTVRLGMPQVERGLFPTSPIRTIGAQVTRPADNITLDPSVIVPEGHTMLWQYTPICTAAQRGTTAVPGGWARTAAFLDTCYSGLSSGGSSSGAVIVGGASLGGSSVAGITGTGRIKVAQAFELNNFRSGTNGILGVLDSAVAVPAGPPAFMRLGDAPWGVGNGLNGWMELFATWKRRVTDAELQAMTL